jgi:hypothetical protein
MPNHNCTPYKNFLIELASPVQLPIEKSRLDGFMQFESVEYFGSLRPKSAGISTGQRKLLEMHDYSENRHISAVCDRSAFETTEH